MDIDFVAQAAEGKLSYSVASPHHLTLIGGGERIRTDDPLRARQVLSQLSYTPD